MSALCFARLHWHQNMTGPRTTVALNKKSESLFVYSPMDVSARVTPALVFKDSDRR